MRKINYDNYFWQEKNVRLRAVQPKDGEAHYYNRFDTPGRLLVNYEVELPPTQKEADEFVDKFKDFEPSTRRIMFTIENLDGVNVGGLNLNSIDERNGTFSIGIQMDRDHRGRGYGTNAMHVLLKYAFLERRLNKFNVSVLDGNIASATMMRNLGCEEEGIRRQMVYTNGHYVDEILFGLTKDEFLTKNKLSLQ